MAKKRSGEMNQSLMKSRHDTLVAARAESSGGGEAGALADFAEDLGRLLGSAERKAATWLDQRKAVGDQLAAIRDKASALLAQLGVNQPVATRARRRSRTTSGRAAAGPRKRRPMSAEAREKIAEAQRRRWAKVRRAKTAS